MLSLTAATALLELAVLLRLAIGRIPLWMFGAYLTANLIRDLVMAHMDWQSAEYARLWMQSEPILWLLLFGTVAEIVLRVTNWYPDLKTFDRRALWGALGVLAVLMILTLELEYAAIDWRYPELRLTQMARRYMLSVLAAYLVLFGWFCRLMVMRLSANMRRHLWILTAYLTLQAGTSLISGYGYGYTPAWLNTATLSLTCLLLASWAALLRRAGESVPALPGLPDEAWEAQQSQMRAIQAFGDSLRGTTGRDNSTSR